ncbi:hypothetical protein BT96DRAFT_91406 [Gymnopus androsaceus JB14]|uniref:Uncharacterized protein n=1 Tax=Gymnopus androsaceus JB14 TaxID=1447944 RepID=A0A6A4HEU4_9AGAR|nr:hypothetical protein BT96DRAFT_91406 [Gymnopus androsaceus JB14]
MVEGEFGKLTGRLRVVALNNDDLTSVVSLFSEDNAQTPINVPTFFYAVEEPRDATKVKIALGDSTKVLDRISGWEIGLDGEANVTLRQEGNQICFMWNGLGADPKLQRKNWDDSFEASSTSQIQRYIRRAARFNRHIAAPSPSNSPISKKLRFLFHRIDTDRKKWTPIDKDLLQGKDRLELMLEENQTKGPYSLTICNDNAFPVWPYIFMCDPEGFIILPWYTPDRGALTSPLDANGELVIGYRDNADDLLLAYRENRDNDLLYLKIFITKERTDFSFLGQWLSAKQEDDLRNYSYLTAPSNEQLKAAELQSKQEELGLKSTKPTPKISEWASMCITIVQIHEPREERESREVRQSRDSGFLTSLLLGSQKRRR